MKRTALVLTLLLATAAFTSAARAGEGCDITSRTVWKNMDAQMAQSLEMPQVKIRTQIMKNITYFARECPEKVTFQRVVPALRDILIHDENPEQRELAYRALEAVGESYAFGAGVGHSSSSGAPANPSALLPR